MVAVDRHHVEALTSRGVRRAWPVLRALRSLSFQLSGAQLGITVSSLVLGYVVDWALGPMLRPLVTWFPGVESGWVAPIVAGLALGLATVLQMIFGELAPKNLAIARPMATAMLFVPPILLVNTLLSPVIRFLNAAANWSMQRFGIEPREELEGVRSVRELRATLRWAAQAGELHGVELELLDRTLSLGDKAARDVLVPRPSVVALNEHDSVADLARVALDSGFSRFPVYEEDGDDVLGVVHVKNVFRVPTDARAATPVTTGMQPALVVPRARDLSSLLVDMQVRRQPLAVVVDEYGSAAGIVTMEDIIEELLGEIEDEYDRPTAQLATRVGEDVYAVAGLIRRDEIHEATGFSMPEGRFETLAGLLLALFQRIPRSGDQIACAGWTLRVVEMDGNRIARVLLTAPRRPGAQA